MQIQGVHVAIVTPFDPQTQKVCERSLRLHLERLAQQGVHGFVPCGTTGEAATLLEEERLKVLEITLDVAQAHKLPVIAGCGSNDTQKAVKWSHQALELGCQATLHVTPYYNRPTPKGVQAHFEKLAQETELPIVLYNVPSRTNVNMSVELVTELCKNPKIIGIKEASGSHSQWLSLAEKLDLKKTSLLAGDDNAFATILALGGTGIISASANILAPRMIEIYEKFQQKDLQGAFEVQKQINPWVDTLFMETNPTPLKWALHVAHKLPPTLRLPLVEVSEQSKKQIEKMAVEL